MVKEIFLNLAVKDLKKAIEFFTKLGFTFNPKFTDDSATCMIIGPNIYAMLVVEPRFKEFSPNPLSDPKKNTEVLIALSVETKEAVDELVKNALAAGGTTYKEPDDHGFMYAHSFQDLDGHVWEAFAMLGAPPE